MTRSVLAALSAWAGEAAPREACGLLLGAPGDVREARLCGNVAADPTRFFEIDPVALIAAYRAQRAGGPQVLGYWHSHPTGTAAPSREDLRQASGDARVWAIVTGMETTFWRDDAAGFVALSYAATDG